MKRKAESDLLHWFNKKDRQPLIIRGARQVGKSTLVKNFCIQNNLELLEINLEKMRLNSVAKSDFSIQSLLDEIQLKSKIKITEKTLVFFDEIQESPNLLKYLRYFYEEKPEIAIVSAGSLLEIALKNDSISFPVGRIEFYHLGPMSFTEFLWATGNQFLADKLDELDFSEIVSSEAIKHLINYYYIGGMPKAIKTFVDQNSLVPVRDVQEQILQTYMADFPKYNSRIQVQRIERVFNACINYLGEKVIYSKIDPGANARDTKKVLELLIDARVLLKCSHSSANSVPLKGEEDQTITKLYFLDIGLVNALMRLDFETIDLEMKNNFNTKGILAEQFVAQHLAYLGNEKRGPELFYWLRDKGSQKGEIDFLIQEKNQIIPVEVKASKAGHLKSLFYFVKEKKKSLAFKISLDSFSKKEESHLIENQKIKVELCSLPLFAIEQLRKMI